MFRVSTLVGSTTNRLNTPSSTDSGLAESAGATTLPSMRALCCGFASMSLRSSEMMVRVNAREDPAASPAAAPAT